MPKADLIFRTPLMNAAGILGFAPDPRGPIPWDHMGAFITNPISLRPRAAAEQPAVLEYAGGFLLHTGLPNPGFSAAVEAYARRWADSEIPIIVHLMADRPEETREMVHALESRDNIMAVELGFAPLLSDDIVLLAIEMSRGELPLIVCLPHDQVLRLGTRVMREGAAAVSLAAPRGALQYEGQTVSGRLLGPALLPLALGIVRAAAKAGLPIIGAGGLFYARDVEAMIAAGAIAVQADAQFWIPAGNEKGLVK
jgi:dihydroorotate dehydrogenase